MKASTIKEKSNPDGCTLKIKFESKEELRRFFKITQYDVTIPEAVFSRDSKKAELLCEDLGVIHKVLIKEKF